MNRIHTTIRYPLLDFRPERIAQYLVDTARSAPDETRTLHDILLESIRLLPPHSRQELLQRLAHLDPRLRAAANGIPKHTWVKTPYGILCEGCHFAVEHGEVRASSRSFLNGPCTGRYEDTARQLQETPSRRSS